MRIVCAASVFAGREAFSTLGKTVILPDKEITSASVRDADVLIVRSKTLVGERLLSGSRVRFVGTATAGHDHVDLDYLEAMEIACCAAPGCNANGVAEYIMAALFCLARRYGLVLAGLSVGVVGVGHVGRRVVAKAEAIGMRALQNDPPLQEATGDPVFRPLEEVLSAADFVTLHVPLSFQGPCPTVDMANFRFFEQVRPGCFFLNTSRGEVADSDALLFALEHGAVKAAVLDVWDHEPAYRTDLLEKAALGTPHIAGYSQEGKLGGTVMVYHAVCGFYEIEPCWKPDALPAGQGPARMDVDAHGREDEEVLGELIRTCYDIEQDDRSLRAGAVSDVQRRGARFSKAREEYPVRREFSSMQVLLRRASSDLKSKVAGLGFSVVDS